MRKTKFYYLVEPIDIDGDKNDDGFLISQYKIGKDNHKNFTKNKYLTFKDFKKYMEDFKHKSLIRYKGGSGYHQYPHPHPQQQQQVVMMTPAEYNNYMNNMKYNYHNQPPPQFLVQNKSHSSFGSNFMNGLGGGIGAGIGFGVADAAMEGLFGF
jgi:hypothetical protein